ncbi:MAG TPA: hypothetical protein VM123_20975 [archaeon]|nr:hypothetical protein [archaeon]
MNSHDISQYINILKDHEKYFWTDNEYLQKLANTLKENPQAGVFEVVMASYLRYAGHKIEINDLPGSGGLDYIVTTPNGDIFLLEATTLEESSISEKTGLPDTNYFQGEASGFGLETIRTKLSEKSGQIGRGIKYPVIVAVGSWHANAHLFLGGDAARDAFTGKPKIGVNIKNGTHLGEVSSLEESIFFRFNKRSKKTEHCRRNISAVIFVAFTSAEMTLVGILNPAPLRELDITYFPLLPFLRAKNNPLDEGFIETEWLMYYSGDKGIQKLNLPEDRGNLNLGLKLRIKN